VKQSEGTPLRLRDIFLRGASWVLAGKVLSAIATLLANVILARLLTPAQLGIYFLGFSLVTIAAILAQWGLNRGIVKLVASDLALDRQDLAYAHISSALKLVFGVSGVLALMLVSPFGHWLLTKLFDSQTPGIAAWLLGLWIMFKALEATVSETFRGFHEILWATVFGGLTTAVFTSASFFAVYLVVGPTSVNQAVFLRVAAVMLSLFLAYTLLRRRIRTLDRGHGATVSDVAKFGFPLLITSISLLGIRELHIWALAMYRPESEVAILGAVLRLINLLAFPLLVVNAVLPPMVARLYAHKNYAKAQDILQKSATVVSLPAFAVFIIIMFWGEEILGLVYGEYYRAGAIAFSIVTLGQLLNILTGSPGVLLTMSGHEKLFMYAAIAGGVTGVTMSWLIAEDHGVVGVAIGYCVGIISVNAVAWAVSRWKLGINTHGSPLILWRLINELAVKTK